MGIKGAMSILFVLIGQDAIEEVLVPVNTDDVDASLLCHITYSLSSFLLIKSFVVKLSLFHLIRLILAVKS